MFLDDFTTKIFDFEHFFIGHFGRLPYYTPCLSLIPQ